MSGRSRRPFGRDGRVAGPSPWSTASRRRSRAPGRRARSRTSSPTPPSASTTAAAMRPAGSCAVRWRTARSTGAGTLYRLAPDGSVTRVLEDVTISNGFCLDPTARLAYYVDTPTRRIDVFDVGTDGQTLMDRRPFVTVRAGRRPARRPHGRCRGRHLGRPVRWRVGAPLPPGRSPRRHRRRADPARHGLHVRRRGTARAVHHDVPGRDRTGHGPTGGRPLQRRLRRRGPAAAGLRGLMTMDPLILVADDATLTISPGEGGRITLARRRRQRAHRDRRLRPDPLGLLPDGAVRRPDPRWPLPFRWPRDPASAEPPAARHPRDRVRAGVGGGGARHPGHRPRAGLAVRRSRPPALRAATGIRSPWSSRSRRRRRCRGPWAGIPGSGAC